MSNQVGPESLSWSCQPPWSLTEAASQAAFNNAKKSVIEDAAGEKTCVGLTGIEELKTVHASVLAVLGNTCSLPPPDNPQYATKRILDLELHGAQGGDWDMP